MPVLRMWFERLSTEESARLATTLGWATGILIALAYALGWIVTSMSALLGAAQATLSRPHTLAAGGQLLLWTAIAQLIARPAMEAGLRTHRETGGWRGLYLRALRPLAVLILMSLIPITCLSILTCWDSIVSRAMVLGVGRSWFAFLLVNALVVPYSYGLIQLGIDARPLVSSWADRLGLVLAPLLGLMLIYCYATQLSSLLPGWCGGTRPVAALLSLQPDEYSCGGDSSRFRPNESSQPQEPEIIPAAVWLNVEQGILTGWPTSLVPSWRPSQVVFVPWSRVRQIENVRFCATSSCVTLTKTSGDHHSQSQRYRVDMSALPCLIPIEHVRTAEGPQMWLGGADLTIHVGPSAIEAPEFIQSGTRRFLGSFKVHAADEFAPTWYAQHSKTRLRWRYGTDVPLLPVPRLIVSRPAQSLLVVCRIRQGVQ